MATQGHKNISNNYPPYKNLGGKMQRMDRKSQTQKLGDRTIVGKWHCCEVRLLLTPSGLTVTDEIKPK